MEHKVLYKSVKKAVGAEITLWDVLNEYDGWTFEQNVDKEYVFDINSDTIVVIVGGKKVDPKKVKIKLTEDV